MKKIATGILAAGMSMTAAGTAFADQCAWITQKQMEAGIAAVQAKHGFKYVVSYCEPCGDKMPTASKVKKLMGASFVSKGNGLFAAKINRTEVDLAYTFLSKTGQNFLNAAKLLNKGLVKAERCPASGVSASIRIAPAAPAKPQAGQTGQVKKPTSQRP